MAEHSPPVPPRPPGGRPCDRSSLPLSRPGVYNRLRFPFRITSLQSDRQTHTISYLWYWECACVRDTTVTVATNNNNNNNNNNSGCSMPARTFNVVTAKSATGHDAEPLKSIPHRRNISYTRQLFYLTTIHYHFLSARLSQ